MVPIGSKELSVVLKSRPTILVLAAAAAVGCHMAAVQANLNIVPIFDSSLTSSPNAVYFESQINSAISELDGYIANPITVDVKFSNAPGVLGSNSTAIGSIPYTTYLAQLAARPSLTTYDTTALASLPSTNPVNSGTTVAITGPLAQALGDSSAVTPYANPQVGTGGYISVGLSYMASSPTSSGYDLKTVVLHELDEVLSIGGNGSELNASFFTGSNFLTTGPVGTMDLYRYSANGVRSYTTSPTGANGQPLNVYFSIDGGKTNLTYFNQQGYNNGGDFGDWAGYGTPKQVQDYSLTADTSLNLGRNELIALDVAGWTLTSSGLSVEAGNSVPECSTLAILGVLSGMLLLRRRAGRQ